MRRSVALAAFLIALTARAEIRVVEPRDGDLLWGGSTAVIEWTSDDRLAGNVEEWEAFLSVDGGRYYATRLTPHLDARIRRFTFEVPNVESGSARLLLRFGDEKREEEVEIPARFTIHFDPTAMRARRALADAEGEPAREGAPGVAMWVEGARDGSGMLTVARQISSFRSERAVAVSLPSSETGEEAAGVLAAARSSASQRLRRPAHRPSIVTAHRVLDLLLATRRLNL